MISIKYVINGRVHRRRYPKTPEGVTSATERVAALVASGVIVVVKGLPRGML